MRNGLIKVTLSYDTILGRTPNVSQAVSHLHHHVKGDVRWLNKMLILQNDHVHVL